MPLAAAPPCAFARSVISKTQGSMLFGERATVIQIIGAVSHLVDKVMQHKFEASPLHPHLLVDTCSVKQRSTEQKFHIAC